MGLSDEVKRDWPEGLRFLTANDVCKLVGLSRTTIYRLTQEGKFPHSIPLSPCRVVYIQSEIQAWMERKVVDARMSESEPMTDSRGRPIQCLRF